MKSEVFRAGKKLYKCAEFYDVHKYKPKITATNIMGRPIGPFDGPSNAK